MRRLKRRVGVVGLLGLLGLSVIGVGIAWAAWTKTENGTAKGMSRTMEFTVDAVTATADLYPSATPTGSVRFSIDNPNPFPIEVTTVGSNGLVGSGDTGCDPGSITVGTVSGLTGASYEVAASDESAMTVAGVLTMAIDAPDACQGVEFTVPLTVTAQQVIPS